MAASETLHELANKAEAASTRLDTAKAKDRDALTKDVEAARTAASDAAETLRTRSSDLQDSVGGWWTGIHESWSQHVTSVRFQIDEKKAERETEQTVRRAERAEDYAAATIALAEAAFREAEYAVLDAMLARMEADDATAA